MRPSHQPATWSVAAYLPAAWWLLVKPWATRMALRPPGASRPYVSYASVSSGSTSPLSSLNAGTVKVWLSTRSSESGGFTPPPSPLVDAVRVSRQADRARASRPASQVARAIAAS
ncbi:MAG: hypothetical protein DMD87_27700 [Candidatus Rokuibacteriota bacterium]|nr:MAG: hypothetical protein DMD87_27700 [Candidatus Rokubacteria bacterium]